MTRPPIDVRYPPFDEAVRRLRSWLKSEDWPDQVVWITSNDARHRGRLIMVRSTEPQRGERRAQKTYNDAIERDQGACFYAICHNQTRTFVRSIRPRSAKAAERMMIGDTVKFARTAEPFECMLVSRVGFWFGTLGRPLWCRDSGDVIE